MFFLCVKSLEFSSYKIVGVKLKRFYTKNVLVGLCASLWFLLSLRYWQKSCRKQVHKQQVGIEVILLGHNGQCKGFVHSQVNLKQRSGWEVGAQVKRGNNKPLFIKTSLKSLFSRLAVKALGFQLNKLTWTTDHGTSVFGLLPEFTSSPDQESGSLAN